MMDHLIVRTGAPDDTRWIAELLVEHWASVDVVSRGVVHRASELPALVAARGDERLGLLTHRRHGDSCEIVTFDALAPRLGVGTALLAELVRRLRDEHVRRLWLITTNDNLAALRFYQRRGFALAALHRDALDVSRRLKPGIPLIGHDGIPIRDELELEQIL